MEMLAAVRVVLALALLPLALTAQVAQDVAPLKNWPAPLYWQPSHSEAASSRLGNATETRSPQVGASANAATLPLGSNALVFVAMTPCRVVDTRTGQGFSGAFGPPSLVGQVSRTFPVQSSTGCTIPSIARAYSFNVTVVPPGFLGFLTLYPTGAARPNASTLNDSTGLVLANAAIVAAGTSGSVDVFANNNTDLIIDINGYYAPPTDINGNTAVGVLALSNNITGISNVALGGDALFHNLSGSANTATGGLSLFSNSTGSNNTATGAAALQSNNGDNNTANGSEALYANTTGFDNTATGFQALLTNTTGYANTASGYQALYSNNDAYGNTGFGSQALFTNISGLGNTAVGDSALLFSTASGDTAIGYGALYTNHIGANNTAAGYAALYNNDTGSSDTAIGYGALLANNIGANNTATGYQALNNNTAGNFNTAYGYNALFNNSGPFAGNNSAFGANALSSNQIGINNIAIGNSAGNQITGNANIDIGNSGSSGDSGVSRIGTDGQQFSFFAAGIWNVFPGGNDILEVLINRDGKLGTMSSSRRYKEDIRDMAQASSGLLRLRPVIFRYKKPDTDGSKGLNYGLIAEEVAEVYPDLVVKNKDGQIETVQYQKLTPMLLNEVQKLHQDAEKQSQHVHQQDETIHSLEARLAVLEAVLSSRATVTSSPQQP